MLIYYNTTQLYMWCIYCAHRESPIFHLEEYLTTRVRVQYTEHIPRVTFFTYDIIAAVQNILIS